MRALRTLSLHSTSRAQFTLLRLPSQPPRYVPWPSSSPNHIATSLPFRYIRTQSYSEARETMPRPPFTSFSVSSRRWKGKASEYLSSPSSFSLDLCFVPFRPESRALAGSAHFVRSTRVLVGRAFVVLFLVGLVVFALLWIQAVIYSRHILDDFQIAEAIEPTLVPSLLASSQYITTVLIFPS